MSKTDAVLKAADAGLQLSLDLLFQFLSIPSISTDPAYKPECRRAAQWASDQLSEIGFTSRVADTSGHPMVLAHRRPANAQRHVLFYGHYDVQPPEPLDLWQTPPFEPRIETGPRGERIVARGASDDKGQLFTFLEAARAWIAEAGELPVAVTVLLEGEEESGSPSLKPFFDANKEELRADLALVCDTGQWDPETPAITTRLRGLVGEEVTISTAGRDLHSGMYGGPALNPIRVLTGLLSALHDDSGRVTVPGFYDGVAELPEAISRQWSGLGFDDASFLGEAGLTPGVAGEKGRSVLEQIWARPTCEINGIHGGYTGEGFKTVIPAQASAKISFRLVGKQDPAKVRSAFREFLKARLPEGATIAFREHGASAAIELEADSPALALAAQGLQQEWGKEPILMGSGGSIPIVGAFRSELGMPTLMIGFAQDDDRIHSPNEKYDLKAFHKGIRSWVRILGNLGEWR
ncbi:dipeptidase [Terrihabitans rhizophilus]|uniref:Dipeptidase n=1 Tax=Terrihabitans rhizophilus TaxID=3092662 RepID=A0ABU4RQS6_9HYPH|nr:dipeptidase [Terrihabitans sp. PJ23]MDX6806538.1 dipeptidase [Terrihabitans sp. PJ23]